VGGRTNANGHEVDENGTYYLVWKATVYDYREGNVVVSIYFNTHGTREELLDPNGIYYEPWMYPIAELQMSNVDCTVSTISNGCQRGSSCWIGPEPMI
jgi:hypothetical protein